MKQTEWSEDLVKAPGLEITVPLSGAMLIGARATPAANCGRSLEIDLSWHWQAHRDTLTNALFTIGQKGSGDVPSPPPENPKSPEEQAFYDVHIEQHHSPPVENSYISCHDSDADTFWVEGVCKAALGAAWDRNGLQNGHLNWQWVNNPDSIKNAQRAYTGFDPFPHALGMYWLMWGQRHNESAQWAYRAAFRDDPDWLWGVINAYR